MKLYAYIVKKYFRAIAVLILVIMLIILIANLMENLRKYSGDNVNIGYLLVLSLLSLPSLIQQSTPFIVLFAALYLIRQLSSSNELDVIKSNGVSIWMLLRALIPFIIILGVLFVLILSPLASTLNKKQNEINNRATNTLVSVATNNFWIVDKHQNNELIIKSPRVYNEGYKVILISPTLFQIIDNHLVQRIDGSSAVLDNGVINVINARIKRVDTMLPQFQTSFTLQTTLRSKNLQNIVLEPDMISFWELPHFISSLKKLGLSTTSYFAYFYNLIFYPFMLVGMFLIGIGFSLSKQKRRNNTTIIIAGVAFGFLIYFATNLINTFGSTGILPPLFTSVGELVILIFAGLFLIVSKEGL